MKISLQAKAELGLAGVALLWGLTFPFIRIALTELTSLHLLLLRSAIASLVFLPFILATKENRKRIWKYLPYGTLLGILFFFSYFTQSIGLETIASGRSAFLTNLSIIFVPFLSPLFKCGFPTKNDLISAGIALCGLFLLTNPLQNHGISSGDMWTVVCALLYSLQIHILQIAMRKKPNALMYAFWQIMLISVCSLAWLPFTHTSTPIFPVSAKAMWSIIYLGVIGMSFSVWMQTKFQQHTSPERASVIYILEPLCATFFGFIILNETLSLKNICGAGFIVAAVLWTPFVKEFKKYFLKMKASR